MATEQEMLDFIKRSQQTPSKKIEEQVTPPIVDKPQPVISQPTIPTSAPTPREKKEPSEAEMWLFVDELKKKEPIITEDNKQEQIIIKNEYAEIEKPSYGQELLRAIRQGQHESTIGMIFDAATGNKFNENPIHTISKELMERVKQEGIGSDIAKTLEPEQLNQIFGSIKEEKTGFIEDVKRVGLSAAKFTSNLIMEAPVYIPLIGPTAKLATTATAKLLGKTAIKESTSILSQKSYIKMANNFLDSAIKGDLGALISEKTTAKLVQSSIIGAGTFAGGELVTSPIKQAIEAGSVSPAKVAEDVATGLVTGAVLGPALDVVAFPLIGSASKTIMNDIVKPTFKKASSLIPVSKKQQLAIQELRAMMAEPTYIPDKIQLQEGYTMDSLVRINRSLDKRAEKLQTESYKLSDDIENLGKFEVLNDIKSKFHELTATKTTKLVSKVSEKTGKLKENLELLTDKINQPDISKKELSLLNKKVNITQKKIVKYENYVKEQSEKIKSDQLTKLNKILDEKKSSIQSLLNEKESKLGTINDEIRRITKSKEYQVLFKAKELGLKPNEVISKRGFIYDPDIIKQAMELPDLGQKIPQDAGLTLKAFSLAKKRAKAFDYATKDFLRTGQELDGRQRGFLIRNVHEPLVKSYGNALKNANKSVTEWGKYFKEAGFNPPKIKEVLTDKAKLADYVHQNEIYKEKTIQFNKILAGELAPEELSKVPKEMVDLVNYSRRYLDDSIQKINIIKENLGHKPIPYRKDYFPTIHELDFFDLLGTTPEAYSEVIGKTHKDIKLGFDRPRTSMDDFTKDPIEAIKRYIDREQSYLHMAEPLAQAEGIINHLKPKAREYYTDTINILRGYQSLDDVLLSNMTLGSNINVGQGVKSKLDWLTRRTSRGTIPYNLSVLFLQPTTIIRTAGQTSYKSAIISAVKGVKGLTEHPEKLHEWALKGSPEYNARYYQGSLDVAFTDEKKHLSSLTQELDLAMFRYSLATFFRHGKTALKMSDKEAMIYANQGASKTQDIYNKAFGPGLMRRSLGRSIGQFGTFSFGLFQQFVNDLPKTMKTEGKNQMAKQFTRLYGGMIAANYLSVSVGMNAPFNLPFMEFERDREGIDLRLTLDPGALAPVLSPLSRYGAPMVWRGIIGLFKTMFNVGDISIKKKNGIPVGLKAHSLDAAEAIGDLKDTLPPLAFKGAVQLKKSLLGFEAAYNGYFLYGKEEIPVEGLDIPRAIMFGPYNTIEAQIYRTEKRRKKEQKRREQSYKE